MNQPPAEIKRHYAPVIGVFALLFFASLITQITDGRAWAAFSKPVIEQGEWWRMLTAHFTHLDWMHFWMNMGGSALCLFVFRTDVKPVHWIISAVLISIFSSACMMTFHFNYGSYVGFSDTLYGWIIIGALAMLPKEPKLALLIIAIFGGRVTYENIVHQSLIDSFMANGKVAVESHAYGFIGGIIYSFSTNRELRRYLLCKLTGKKLPENTQVESKDS